MATVISPPLDVAADARAWQNVKDLFPGTTREALDRIELGTRIADTLPAADQLRTIYVLAQLATRGLPVISWHLSGTTVDQLEGQAGPDSDEIKRSTVAAYAEFLGATPTERRRNDHTKLTVAGVFRGVRVTVYAVVEQVSA